MKINLLHILLFQSAFLAVMALTELLYRVFRVNPEITRKIAHIGLCLVALAIPFVTHSIGVAAALILAGSISLYLGTRYKVFGSVNDVERKTVGGPAVMAALFTCYTIAMLLGDLALFYIPVLILAFGDSAAGLTGIFLKVKRWPLSTAAGRANKSYAGSLVFFLITLLIVVLVFPLFYSSSGERLMLTALLLGAVGALFEAFSGKGYDNITVPIAVMVTLMIQNAI